jgi:hypothetical protein
LQGPAQAQNMRDSIEAAGLDISMKVGLRAGSKSVAEAEACGFKPEAIGEVFDVIAESDLVMLLISDGAQALMYPRILAAMKPGATLGLSHGFLLGIMKNDGAEFRKDINVVLVAPKGMGCVVLTLLEVSFCTNTTCVTLLLRCGDINVLPKGMGCVQLFVRTPKTCVTLFVHKFGLSTYAVGSIFSFFDVVESTILNYIVAGSILTLRMWQGPGCRVPLAVVGTGRSTLQCAPPGDLSIFSLSGIHTFGSPRCCVFILLPCAACMSTVRSRTHYWCVLCYVFPPQAFRAPLV